MLDPILQLKSLPLPDEARQKSDIHFGLIVPPSPFVVPIGWEWVHTAPFEGPSIIASIIKGQGYRFTLFDQRKCFDPQDISGKLKDIDLVGIATYGDGFSYLRSVCEILKQENRKRPIILGGPLVTSAPELVLGSVMADFAVVGEGELTIIEFMDFLNKEKDNSDIKDIKGLAFKGKDGKIIVNQKREQMASLDFLPFQDLSVWGSKKKNHIPEIFLSTSRGCARACSFCYRTMPKISLKSVSRMRDEISYLSQYGFENVWWNDLCFVSDRPRVHQLLEEAFGKRFFAWNCFSRVTDVDLPVLLHMREKGCRIILYGFEAISSDILEFYRKKICKNDMINAIEVTREAGINVGGLFIIGAPEETKASLKNMVDFSKDFREVTRVKYLSALPGTPLYDFARQKKLINDEVKHLEFLSGEESIEEDIDKEGFVFFSPHLTKEDLRMAYREVNGLIEKRPYDYKNQGNNFLDKSIKFQRRC